MATNYQQRNDLEAGTIVFIMGAGCSKDCGAPVMNDFVRRAAELGYRRNNPLAKRYDQVWDFRRECLGMSYALANWWDNIEDLFAQAHFRKMLGRLNADIPYNALAEVIWDVYRQPNGSKLVWKKTAVRFRDGKPDKDAGEVTGLCGYQRFASRLADINWMRNSLAPRPVVITTNYDVHLEMQLLWAHKVGDELPMIPAYVGLSPTEYSLDELSVKRVLPKDRDTEPMPVEILKLHGSINWFIRSWDDSGTVEVKGKPVFDRFGQIPPILDIQQMDADAIMACGELGSPLIVPPLLSKTAIHPTIEKQWNEAILTLSRARVIFIIGYSFPESDAFMFRLLSEGLLNNKGLAALVIVNPDGSKWQRRVSSKFAPQWAANQIRWVDARFEDIASLITLNSTDSILKSVQAMQEARPKTDSGHSKS